MTYNVFGGTLNIAQLNLGLGAVDTDSLLCFVFSYLLFRNSWGLHFSGAR